MNPVLENPKHSKYMYEFRTNQCEKFIDHKCNLHKPYNCFDWHFPNQRRRIPLQLTNGTFNYNPDLYCNSYDQNTGYCPNENECKYVHMNVGDTERRYHPRYYKTGMCIYETNTEGVCSKNGVHCAFAHDQSDIRLAVLDIRETIGGTSTNLSAQLEKDRVLTEDPIWNSMEYVLAYYKTTECRKMPKTCRQGYACPFYHNTKDQRRSLAHYSYQSQPCTHLKPSNEEWQDVTFCPDSDQCKFSHSRTEQQFHPEIFKSSKCNDILRENYCPRGPFCAFSHNDDEMNNGQYIVLIDSAFRKFGSNRRRSNSANQCLSTNTIATTSNEFTGGSSVPNSSLSMFSKNFDKPISGGSGLLFATSNTLATNQNANLFPLTNQNQNRILINVQPPNLVNSDTSNLMYEFDKLTVHTNNSNTNNASQSARSSPASCPNIIGGNNYSQPITGTDLISEYESQMGMPTNVLNLTNEASSTIPQQQDTTPVNSKSTAPPAAMITSPSITSPDYKNIKVILERALSSSSNVNKMSDHEINKLLAQHSQDYATFEGTDISTITNNLIEAAASNWASPSINTDSSQQTDLSASLSGILNRKDDRAAAKKKEDKEKEDVLNELIEKTKECERLHTENKLLYAQLTCSNNQQFLVWLEQKKMDSQLKQEIIEQLTNSNARDENNDLISGQIDKET